MTALYLVLAVLLAVGISQLLSSKAKLPLPLVQIGIGACLSAIPALSNLVIDPLLFLAIFIPPILFYDGFRASKRDFVTHSGMIWMLAVFLVITNVIVLGFFVHWLIPGIPMVAGFILAAVVSPTDVVATRSVGGDGLPRALAAQLEGESLINDATGLFLLKVALAGVALNSLDVSATSVITDFAWVGLGGAIFGSLLSYIVGATKVEMSRAGLDDPYSHVAILLALPFIAYLVANSLGLSGILAAVCAGLVQSRATLQPKRIQTRILSRQVWSMVDFIFNGAAFVVMGLLLPSIIGLADTDPVLSDISALQLLGYVVSITTFMIVVRTSFSYCCRAFEAFVRRRKGRAYCHNRLLMSLITGVAGVRGVVTVCAAISVPLVVSGVSFDHRGLMVLISTGVVVMSMIVALVLIKPLAGMVKEDDLMSEDEELMSIRREARQAGLDWLCDWTSLIPQGIAKQEVDQFNSIISKIIEDYRDQLNPALDGSENLQEVNSSQSIELSLRIRALQAERNRIISMRSSGSESDRLLQQVIKEIDFQEAALS